MDLDDDEQLREKLTKLAAHLGTNNVPEAESTWSAIDALLRRYERGWGDVIDHQGRDAPRYWYRACPGSSAP